MMYQSFLWDKHNIHRIQDDKLHTPKAMSEEPIVDLYNIIENIQVASRNKILFFFKKIQG